MSNRKSIIREVNVKFLEVPGIYMEQWNAFLAFGVIWATGSMSLHPVMATEKCGLGVGKVLECSTEPPCRKTKVNIM